jgi:hypothetical protein
MFIGLVINKTFIGVFIQLPQNAGLAGQNLGNLTPYGTDAAKGFYLATKKPALSATLSLSKCGVEWAQKSQNIGPWAIRPTTPSI